MKKITCCVLVLVLSLMSVIAYADGLSPYMTYADATMKMEDLLEVFIEELNEKIDRGEALAEIEKALYFQYLRAYLDMKVIFALQCDAMTSGATDGGSAIADAISAFISMINSAESKYENGEATFEEAVVDVRTVLNPFWESAE